MCAKRLVRFVPSFFDPDDSIRREIYCLPALHSWLDQKDRKKSADYKPKIRVHLSVFVKGKEVNNEDYMKTWASDIWELRIQFMKKKENTRIFGAFIKPDFFLCVHWKMRSYFGNKSDPKWRMALDHVVDEWAILFPSYTPVMSKPFSNCVTFNCYDKDLVN